MGEIVEPEIVETTFDYTTLDTEDRVVLQQRAREARTGLRTLSNLVRQTAATVWELGGTLADAQDRLAKRGSGTFLTWCAAEFPDVSRRTIYNAINVYRQFPEFATVANSELDMSLRALYLLAAPSTPDLARAEALARAATGQTISHTDARHLVEQHKPAAPSSSRQPGTEGVAALKAHGWQLGKRMNDGRFRMVPPSGTAELLTDQECAQRAQQIAAGDAGPGQPDNRCIADLPTGEREQLFARLARKRLRSTGSGSDGYFILSRATRHRDDMDEQHTIYTIAEAEAVLKLPVPPTPPSRWATGEPAELAGQKEPAQAAQAAAPEPESEQQRYEREIREIYSKRQNNRVSHGYALCRLIQNRDLREHLQALMDCIVDEVTIEQRIRTLKKRVRAVGGTWHDHSEYHYKAGFPGQQAEYYRMTELLQEIARHEASKKTPAQCDDLYHLPAEFAEVQGRAALAGATISMSAKDGSFTLENGNGNGSVRFAHHEWDLLKARVDALLSEPAADSDTATIATRTGARSVTVLARWGDLLAHTPIPGDVPSGMIVITHAETGKAIAYSENLDGAKVAMAALFGLDWQIVNGRLADTTAALFAQITADLIHQGHLSHQAIQRGAVVIWSRLRHEELREVVAFPRWDRVSTMPWPRDDLPADQQAIIEHDVHECRIATRQDKERLRRPTAQAELEIRIMAKTQELAEQARGYLQQVPGVDLRPARKGRNGDWLAYGSLVIPAPEPAAPALPALLDEQEEP